jgi:hypothetical protein
VVVWFDDGVREASKIPFLFQMHLFARTSAQVIGEVECWHFCRDRQRSPVCRAGKAHTADAPALALAFERGRGNATVFADHALVVASWLGPSGTTIKIIYTMVPHHLYNSGAC